MTDDHPNPRPFWTTVRIDDEDLFARFREATARAGHTVQKATHEALRLYIEAGEEKKADEPK